MTKISFETFHSCLIIQIKIPRNVREIDRNAFQYCQKLEAVDFENYIELQLINECSFQYTSIKTLKIPKYVTQIKSHAFSSKKLEQIDFEENSELCLIGENSFAGSLIKTIIIPSHVKVIDSGAFNNCKHLETVEFEDNSSLFTINNYAFNLSAISTLIIPASLSFLNFHSFKGITNLTNIIVSPQNNHFKYYNDDLLLYRKNKNEEIYDSIVIARSNIENVIIPPFITFIYEFAFENCIQLKSFEILKNTNITSLNIDMTNCMKL